MKYDLEYCKNNNISIHCLNRDEQNQLLEFFELKGFVWLTGEKPTQWQYKYQDCYEVGSYGQIYWATLETAKLNYTVISFNQFITDNTPRLYTEAEVLEIERKAWEAGRETEGTLDFISIDFKYNSFEEYKAK